MSAVESAGLVCTGRCLSLNSMENRVYEVELELPEGVVARTPSERFRVAKFYRPGRWSAEQILEEHQFLLDLQAAEIPAIAPLRFPDGETLRTDTESGIHYCLFPKVGGRSPDELSTEQLERIGRLLARIHAVGATRTAPNRVRIGPQAYALNALDFLLAQKKIPAEYEAPFTQVVREICRVSQAWFEDAVIQRIHGDCHFGNLLWNDQGPFFLDFDDMVNGPPVQDLWMVVPGRDAEARAQFSILLEAYSQLRAFDPASLRLVEPLRALRFVHFAAWISKRWEDPAFPRAFPQYGDPRYWRELLSDLEEQLGLIQNPHGSNPGGADDYSI